MRTALATLALLAAAAAPAAAYFGDVAVGGRAKATGLVAGAIVEDVSAYYWNPAALSRLPGGEALAEYGRPHAVQDLADYTLAAGTTTHGFGVAAAWHRLAISGVYAEDLFHVAAGRTLWRDARGHWLSVGATLKLGRVSVDSFDDPDNPGSTVDFGSATAVSGDLGALWQTPWRLDVAALVRDVNAPEYELIDGSGGTEVPRKLELSAAYRWNPESTLNLGWNQISASGESNLNLGLEIWFYDVFAIRSGLTDVAGIFDPESPATRFQFAGGFGVRHSKVLVDAAFTTNRDLGASYGVTLRLPFGRGGTP